MRKTAVRKPEFLIETRGLDDERVGFPFTDRTPVVQGIVRIAGQLTREGAAVCVDHPKVPIAAANEDENALEISIFDKLQSVGKLVLPRAARRDAIEKHRIVSQEITLPQFHQLLLHRRASRTHASNRFAPGHWCSPARWPS